MSNSDLRLRTLGIDTLIYPVSAPSDYISSNSESRNGSMIPCLVASRLSLCPDLCISGIDITMPGLVNRVRGPMMGSHKSA
ncbi:Sodium- and chloride-dependent GABA transporter 1 [Fusarium oxysporum f. sp. albedinis]|nr:Sodium- and chloride-dependent GABA transporter 1 [Fusarium oxysporum f. sp. albedinis]